MTFCTVTARRGCERGLVLPPKCRDLIERGALVAVSHSGGKDSQAMTILLSRVVPREQLLVIHAPLGEIEWPGTFEHIEATMPSAVPLILAPVASGKTLLERVEERAQWPDSARRCAFGSRDPLERELQPLPQAHPPLRRRIGGHGGCGSREPGTRKREPWRRNDRNSGTGRECRRLRSTAVDAEVFGIN